MANIEKKRENAVAPKALNPSFVMNALIEELNKPFEPKEDDDRDYPDDTTFMDVIVQTTVRQAAYGDRHARKEIFDRIDGKPTPQLTLAQIMILLDQIGWDKLQEMRGKTIDIDAEKTEP